VGHRAGWPRASVVLSGGRDGGTHREVAAPALLRHELRLVGGRAVMCRVGTPHGVTVDPDEPSLDLAAVAVGDLVG